MKNRRREEDAKQVNFHVAFSMTKFGTFTSDNLLQINLPFFIFLIHSFINFSFVTMVKNRRLDEAANKQVDHHIVVGATNFDQMAHPQMTFYLK